jgi:vacuolar protein sorting-associated protein IST1
MLDVYAMLESYCNLLTERIHLIEEERECPDELKEAISSLLFASSRCGDFPELQEIRAVLTSRYGRDFTARAIELRNNCGVNPKVIQKLSTRQTELENRMKVLKEIAAEKNISLQLEGGSSSTEMQEKIELSKTSSIPASAEQGETSEIGKGNDNFSNSLKLGRKYKDVADAAQAAFESAAYAAAAARAAVELSRSSSDPHGPDYRGSSKFQRQKSCEPEPNLKNKEITKKDSKFVTQSESISDSSSVSTDDIVDVPMTDSDEIDPIKLLEKDTVFIYSDSESNYSGSSSLKTNPAPGPSINRNTEVSNPSTEIHYSSAEMNRSKMAGSSSLNSEAPGPSMKSNPEESKPSTEIENEAHYPSAEINSSTGLKMKAGSGTRTGTEPSPTHTSERRKHRFNIGKGLFSLRNRGLRGY